MCAACFAWAPAYATLAPHLQRGVKLVQLPVPGRNAEVCVVPKHLVDAGYSDEDAKTEAQLCDIDVNSNSAVCPKLNSTNPGLDMYSLPQGSTPQQVQASRCKISGLKKIAKYKLSTSCSYTPSILGYYHLSRALGGIANVPPSVLRTFDLKNHIALGRAAIGGDCPKCLDTSDVGGVDGAADGRVCRQPPRLVAHRRLQPVLWCAQRQSDR